MALATFRLKFSWVLGLGKLKGFQGNGSSLINSVALAMGTALCVQGEIMEDCLVEIYPDPQP